MAQIKAKHVALGLSSASQFSNAIIAITDTEGRVWAGDLHGQLRLLVLPEEPTPYTRPPLMPG